MDVPAAGSEQIEDSKDTEEMTELEETERTAASEGAAEPEKVENVTIGSEKYRGFYPGLCPAFGAGGGYSL